MSTKPLLVFGLAVLTGTAGYAIGRGSRGGPSSPSPAPPLDPTGRQGAVVDSVSTDRLESVTSELRALVAELRTEVRSRRSREPAAGPSLAEDQGEVAWEERLRAREPAVVMDAILALRAKAMQRALEMERRARSAETGRIVGTRSRAEEDTARRVRAESARNCREQAERARAAACALDSVRTLEDLARWRVAHDVKEWD